MDQTLLGVEVRGEEVERILGEYEPAEVELMEDVACCDAWHLEGEAAALVLTDAMKEIMHFWEVTEIWSATSEAAPGLCAKARCVSPPVHLADCSRGTADVRQQPGAECVPSKLVRLRWRQDFGGSEHRASHQENVRPSAVAKNVSCLPLTAATRAAGRL